MNLQNITKEKSGSEEGLKNLHQLQMLNVHELNEPYCGCGREFS